MFRNALIANIGRLFLLAAFINASVVSANDTHGIDLASFRSMMSEIPAPSGKTFESYAPSCGYQIEKMGMGFSEMVGIFRLNRLGARIIITVREYYGKWGNQGKRPAEELGFKLLSMLKKLVAGPRFFIPTLMETPADLPPMFVSHHCLFLRGLSGISWHRLAQLPGYEMAKERFEQAYFDRLFTLASDFQSTFPSAQYDPDQWRNGVLYFAARSSGLPQDISIRIAPEQLLIELEDPNDLLNTKFEMKIADPV